MKTTILLNLLALSSIAFGADNLVVNDPLYNRQWALKNNGQSILKITSNLDRLEIQGIPGNDINWVDTSAIATPKKDLIVAVLDSGLDIGHPDLAGRIWFNDALCTNAPNAKILPCNGFNFLDGNNNLLDDMGHGTHVAGVIAANRNSIGVAGAADPRIKIMPLKVLNSQVSGFVYNNTKVMTDVIADAMIFAIKNGAEVINLSLGWPKLIDSQKVRQAFQMAEDQNVIVVAATGNNSKDLPVFPCAYENVICVGSIDNRGILSSFSNFGSKVDIVAPGDDIISTLPRNLESRVLRIANYETKQGSSQAAPFVTAAIATLKLLHPGLTNDKVRTLLYNSTKPLTKVVDNHFVKFGALDMKNLLSMAEATTEEVTSFVNPQLKSITEIKYKTVDSRFSFALPLKNLSGPDFNGQACISTSSVAISLDQKCFDVKALKAGSTINLTIAGSLIDLSKDSHIKFAIQVGQKYFLTSLVFSRDLTDDSDLKVENIQGANLDDMAVIDRKISRMTRVMDKFHRLDYPEYFYLERAKQTATSTVVSILTKENGAYIVKSVVLPLVKKVLSIHRQDINGDGKLDTFIYALSAKQDQLLFFNFDKDLNPLFGKYSKWAMQLSTFEGLPLDGGIERFEWLKVNHPQLGNIIVPSIFKAYTMPEADNSKDVLARVTTIGNHQYYLNPTLQTSDDSMKIELRVIDSVAAMKKMRKDFNLFDDQTITIIKPFPQTDEQSRKGEIHSLATLDDGDNVSTLELVLGFKEMKSNTISNALGLGGALIYPIINATNGQVTKDSVLTSLLNRSSAEFLLKTDAGLSAPLLLNQDWENPVIGLIGSFNLGGPKNFIVENRATVSFLTSEGHFDLPVYRDSTFPGQNFSETLTPILSEGRPGVYINSTLIYGERLYSMIGTREGFIRPLNLSIGIPQGCVSLGAETLESKVTYNYAFLCGDANKQATLKFLPMSAH